MAAQSKESMNARDVIRKMGLVPEVGSTDLGDDEMSLGLPDNFLQVSLTLNGLLPVFLMLQTGLVTKIEPLQSEGLRFYFETNPDPILEQTIQVLRKMLERTVNAPINIYWNSSFLDFVPV